MPFIPHTEEEVRAMLEVIGVASIDDLFDEIPPELQVPGIEGLPPALGEAEVLRLFQDRVARDGRPVSFLGAGAYPHHIPAAVWDLVSRGEFSTAYTPYQAEASQGTLQVIYEYQTMMAGLMGMEVSNASLYDGASALAEAVLMAVRANRRSRARRVLLPRTLHPAWRATVRTLVHPQEIEVVEIPFDPRGGHTPLEALAAWEGRDVTALVVPQPNFFGVLEDVDALTDWAHEQGALVIAAPNPTAMALLRPPGAWGTAGADIAAGEGQPLGIPLSLGGPYFGFLCTRQALVRQMPGRLVGRTVDREGREGFTLTLQAREQHIRRSRATSNICTNQGLMVTAATLYLALLGPEGLRRVAAVSHANTRTLTDRLVENPHVHAVFDRPFFHERVLRFDVPLERLLRPLAAHNLLPGYPLGEDYPELQDCLLVCATEVHTPADIDFCVDHLFRIIERQTRAGCPIKPKMA
ncbi:MAG: aminomethyl-transferring glycine dehydrogenase subunit GcvPA [Gammaproteobacteria bacterium]|nr:MAG: aminomethyl-transferring glycine dehydrogenase subunit GcvPA [Gammaproteobacteria bacterium]